MEVQSCSNKPGEVCARRNCGCVPLAIFLAGLFMATWPLCAQSVQHLSITQPGGMPGLPVVTGIEKTTNGVTITWDGPPGFYQLMQQLADGEGSWHPVGAPSLERRATITSIHSNAFFRVLGPAPRYAGSQVCIECHENIHTTEMDTSHSQALETLKRVKQDKNPSCLPCHTVGFGLPTGFISELATPKLAGVQCESCHGPAANHAANEYDLAFRPRMELAATVCGGCHTGSHQPTFEEWSSSGHANVVEDMNPAGRINSCGRCHSGSVRVALLKNDPLPEGDANMGITCVTCHDPHREYIHTNVLSGVVTTNQLRNPVASTNDFFLGTSDVFANKYDPTINVCAQCHNHRGATWTSSARAPHHSPQYNLLLGTIGELDAGTSPHRAAHATRIEKQCVGCHMQTAEHSDSHAAVTGHTFRVERFEACASCHTFPELLTDFTMTVVSNRIQQVKATLDTWALSKAPTALQSKYGARSWEYTAAGELSGGAGPNATEQALIPDNIKKARFNLYIVLNDGSYGVHNGPHAITLLETARNWVESELNK